MDTYVTIRIFWRLSRKNCLRDFITLKDMFYHKSVNIFHRRVLELWGVKAKP